ncbi:MAG: S24/S26 family peptidase [Eubacteriales bacterium]|nr:S24/S26 family peptidase [Eubacteriales bacterium]
MTKNCFEEKKETVNVEALLAKYGTIQMAPKGYSMYPVIVPERDQVILKQADAMPLKRGMVVLYRRADDTLVLHRVYKVKQDGIYLVGDNQVEIEGPIQKSQIKAVLVGLVRKGKRVSVLNLFYVVLTRIWLCFLPLRPQMKKIAYRLKHAKDKNNA